MLQKKIDKLPEWDLSDLYDAPESVSFNADLEQLKKSVHDFSAFPPGPHSKKQIFPRRLKT